MPDETKNPEKADTNAAPPAPMPPEPASADMLYLQDLFEKAKTGNVDAKQKVLLDMLSTSEDGITLAVQEGNEVDRQIKELQQRLVNIRNAVNNERGKARGLAEALLAMRDSKPKAKKKTNGRRAGARTS